MVFGNHTAKTNIDIDNKDITARFHKNNQMSMDAYMSVRDSTSMIRGRIVNHIASLGLFGATSDEVERDLELSHQTASARLTEALAKGELMRSGEKRKTRSGRNAAVLISKEI